MRVPVPHLDPPPSPVEVEARAIHARDLRNNIPDLTVREILADWAELSDEGRQHLLGQAQQRIEARAGQLGEPEGGVR